MIQPYIELIAAQVFMSGGIIISLAEGIKPPGVALLKYTKALVPLENTNKGRLEKHQVSESWCREVPLDEIEKIFHKLKMANIPALPEEAMEPDGIDYSLTIGDGTNSITYTWRTKIPRGWETIGDVANILLSMAGEKEIS